MTPLERGRALSEAGTRRRLAAAALLTKAAAYVEAVYDARALPEPETIIEPAFDELSAAVERYQEADRAARQLAGVLDSPT